MKTIDYPEVLSPMEADYLFPFDEEMNPLPADARAYTMAAQAILTLEDGPACAPITFVFTDPEVGEISTGPDGNDIMLCATATDAAGRKVNFFCEV